MYSISEIRKYIEFKHPVLRKGYDKKKHYTIVLKDREAPHQPHEREAVKKTRAHREAYRACL